MEEVAERIGRLTASEEKGMNEAPKSVCTFAMKRNTGLPTGRES